MFWDDYNLMSGWIHDFYCDDDGSLLIFDINNSNFFECPICHKKYKDEKRKRAWLTKYRYKVFGDLEIYSRKYLETKEVNYLNYIIDALNYYSINYDKFRIHDKDGNVYTNVELADKAGRITSQGLNEAMITIQIVNCIDNIKEYLPQNTLDNVYNLLFPKVFSLLKTQVNKVHNIDCFIVCSIGMMGIISNNNCMIDFAFNSEYSFYKQLQLGVTKDYIWFEGSFHYHLYVLKPILNFLSICKKYNYSIDDNYNKIVKQMLMKCYGISFSDCSLPSPNDGWPNRYLKDYIDVYELGNDIYNNLFSNILDNIKNNKNDSNTCHMLDSGFSNIKNNYYNVFIKYKNNDMSHAHPDKLNIEIKIMDIFLTHDLSTSGYGCDISKKFYKKTYAHNSIVINGIDQNFNCNTNVIDYGNNYIDVEISDLSNNIRRRIDILDNLIVDNIEVKTSKEENIDCFFHCDFELCQEFQYINVDKLDEYPYLSNIKKIQLDKDEIMLKWSMKDIHVVSKLNIKNKQLYICSSPDNPSLKSRTTLLIRTNGNNVSFNTEWNIV